MIKFVIRGKVSRLNMEKKGELLNQIIIQIILVILVFAVFLMMTARGGFGSRLLRGSWLC